MKKMLLLLFGLAAVWSVAAKVTLPDAIGSNMVLQQNTDVKLWGWADPHAAVKVEASWGAKASAKSDGEGRWEVTLKTPAGSYEPQRITVASGDKRVLDNVLIGEVWFCSGQSNMDMPLGGYWNGLIEGGNEVIACADAQRDRIRFLKVAYSQGYTPQDRVPGAWNEFTTATAARCSATAYFFAEMLSRALNVPVGVIDSSWGGSRIECWTPRAALETYPDIDLDEKAVAELPDYMRPMAMYNAMVYPLTRYAVRGFLWYQGESNIGRHTEYAARMADMVAGWRAQWGLGELPFYFVEIAPFGVDSRQRHGLDQRSGPSLRGGQHPPPRQTQRGPAAGFLGPEPHLRQEGRGVREHAVPRDGDTGRQGLSLVRQHLRRVRPGIRPPWLRNLRSRSGVPSRAGAFRGQ